MRILACAFVFLLLALPATAAPVDPALQKQLLAVYDAFNDAIAGGQHDAAVAQRPAGARSQFRNQIKTAEDRKAFMAMTAMMTPDDIEILHSRLSDGGDRAMLVGVARKAVPPGLKDPAAPPAGTVMANELTLTFVREGGTWKYASQTFGLDPARIKRCPDRNFEPVEAYDRERAVSVGGPIVEMAFNPGHTLLIVRVHDEESCAFLPDRETLAKGGFDPALLQPYVVVALQGFPHRADRPKIWVDQLEILEED